MIRGVEVKGRCRRSCSGIPVGREMDFLLWSVGRVRWGSEWRLGGPKRVAKWILAHICDCGEEEEVVGVCGWGRSR